MAMINPVYTEVDLNAVCTNQRLIAVASTDDRGTQSLEVCVKQGENAIDVTNTTITARFVTASDNILLSDNVQCDVNFRGNIIVPFDNAVVPMQSGEIKIEINIVDADDILTTQFPLRVKFNGSILDDAEISQESQGTIPELLAEAKETLERIEGEFDEKADKADTLAGYGIEDAYTKNETNGLLNTKTDNVITDKNRAEVLGGAIAPKMERGSIRNTPTDYIDAQSYIRTKQGFDMWLNPGAVIALTDYAGARFKVWCTHPDGTYTQSGWLTAAYTVSEFGFYQIVMSRDPEAVLSDSDVADLTARLRITNVGIAGYQESNALAPLILGLNGTAYINFSVNMDATPPTATMTIPPDTLIMTTQGHIQLSAQAVTVDFSAINSTAIQIVYNKNTGTVDVVNYQSHDRNHIPIAVLRRNLTDKRYTPLTVSINAPYRINGRWYNLPFSETLTPMILGNSAENYVSVDTKTHTITFPADTLLMVGGDSGYVSLNGGQAYTIDYSGANSTAVKLYYNTNTGTMFVTKYSDNYYCFYPLIAVMRVQRYDNDTVYPSVSIAAPVVIDGKLNGYSDPSRVNNALLKNINHRGYNTVAPENTLPAFRLSKKKGFAIVETDVQRTSDGVYVCLHDRSINRTARNSDGTEISGTVNIDGITYTQAAAYDFGIWKSDAYTGTKIPTLVQFVRLCRAIGLEMYIELKEETITTQAHVSEIVAIVKENGMLENCTFISFIHAHLVQILAVCPTARVGFLCNDAGFNNISFTKSLRGDEFEINVNEQTGTSTFINTQKGDKNVFINLPWDVTSGTALSLAIEEDFSVEVWVVSSNAEPNFININPYVTGFTSNKELGSESLYSRYI